MKPTSQQISGYLDELSKGQALLHRKQRELLQAITDSSDREAELREEVEALGSLVMAMIEKVQQALAHR